MLMQDMTAADPRAKAQLDLLAHLIGSQDASKGKKQTQFRLSLFSDNADDGEDADSAGWVASLCV